MTLASLSAADRVPLLQDPEFAESFLGPNPAYRGIDKEFLDLYWMLRNTVPSDQLVGPDRALAFFERVLGPQDVREFLERFTSMDRAFLNKAQERREDKSDV